MTDEEVKIGKKKYGVFKIGNLYTDGVKYQYKFSKEQYKNLVSSFYKYYDEEDAKYFTYVIPKDKRAQKHKFIGLSHLVDKKKRKENLIPCIFNTHESYTALNVTLQEIKKNKLIMNTNYNKKKYSFVNIVGTFSEYLFEEKKNFLEKNFSCINKLIINLYIY